MHKTLSVGGLCQNTNNNARHNCALTNAKKMYAHSNKKVNENIFQKKIGDLTVLELLKFIRLASHVTRPTLTVDELGKMLNLTRRTIYKKITKKQLPEDLIVNGYKNVSNKRSALFYTDRVLMYLSDEEN